MDDMVRLQKYLSECGVASRRKAEQMISDGEVWVNGQIANLGDKINPKRDVVTVAGKKVSRPKEFKYIMLHKPRGYISTLSDEMGRKSVAELVKDVGVRVYPVGRLDRESEGLLLFTNDGEFSNLLMHPSSHVERTYRVTAKPALKDEDIDRLSLPFTLDGKETTPALVTVIEKKPDRTVLEIRLLRVETANQKNARRNRRRDRKIKAQRHRQRKARHAPAGSVERADT